MSLQSTMQYKAVAGGLEVVTNDLMESQSRIIDAYTAMHGEEEDR